MQRAARERLEPVAVDREQQLGQLEPEQLRLVGRPLTGASLAPLAADYASEGATLTSTIGPDRDDRREAREQDRPATADAAVTTAATARRIAVKNA